jgi:UDP-N-acetylmuramyl pentapeptide phosphotransferase/UDP-N-acetylglucosamine-1-phosphate transferase
MIPILLAVTFLISLSLTYYFTHPETTWRILDEPDDRSLHTHPIPVSGGIAILTAFTLAMGFITWLITFPTYDFFWISCSGLLIAGISFLDDCRHVPAFYRLIIHFIAAYLLLWQGNLWLIELPLPGMTWQLPHWLTITLSLLFVVWMINLYNFMDGMDGFAGGMAIIGFGTLAILGHEHSLFMTMNLLIVSATAGFLVFNFPPARIFMGDVGASSLGFCAAAFSLWGNSEGIFPLWVALLTFSPFIIDATVTLLRRLFTGEKIWLAHKSHYYQRLVELGWGHKRTVLREYMLMIAGSLSAISAPHLSPSAQWKLLIGWGIVYSLLIYLVHWLERRAKCH